jgi:rRNA biogenesis protein RRP5
MEDGALPRGKPQKQIKETQQKSKVFGYKNKLSKGKKDKKGPGKIPSCPKTKDYCQGCITIGSILSFQDDMLFIELPGNARGILPISEINDAFLARMQKAITDEEELPDLENFFSVGDFIMATVTSSGTYPVELSMKPELVNSLLQAEQGQILAAAVREKEDRGYLLDLGMENLKGFLPFPAQVEIGQPIFVEVQKAAGSIIRCKLIKDVFFPSKDVEKPHFDHLRPTDILSAVITSNSSNGALACRIAGSFNGYCSKYSWPDGLAVGDATTVRPTLIDPSQKIVWVTAIPRIVKGERPLCLDTKIGMKAETTVSRIRAGVGIECVMPDESELRAFISMKETKSDVALVAGDKHQIRITERRAIDDLLLASDDPDILSLELFCAEDVKIGDIVTATVDNVNLKIGAFVKLSPFLTALCPKNYVDNLTELKKGDQRKCIILAVNDGHVRVAMKEKLLESKYKRVMSLDDAKEICEKNEWTNALVCKSGKRSLLVEFFNGLYGLILANQLPVTTGEAITKQYTPGYVIKTHISNVDGTKINCSVITNQDEMLKLGDLVTVTVKAFLDDGVRVSLPEKYGEIDAVIQSNHFADYNPLSQKIWKSLNIGDKLHRACLIRYPGQTAPAYFTMKRSIRKNAGEIPKELQTIKQGDKIFGFISGVESYGSFVSFFGRAGGLIHGRILEIGDSVHALVEQVVDGTRVRLAAPPVEGESETFLFNFIKDAVGLNGSYSIGGDIVLSGTFEKSGDFMIYQLTDGWTAITKDQPKEGEALKIIYVDVLNNTIFVGRPAEKTPKVEKGVAINANVVAVFDPIIVAQYKGQYILLPVVNFNNKQDFASTIKPNQELEIIVSKGEDGDDKNEEGFSVLLGVPTYLNNEQLSDEVVAKITTFTPFTCNARLADGRTVRIHRTQVDGEPEAGMEVKGNLITVDNSTYLVTDPKSPQRIEDFHVGQRVRAIIKDVKKNALVLSMSPFVIGTAPALQISNDRTVIQKPLTETFKEGDYFEGWVSCVKSKSVIVSHVDPANAGNILFARIVKIHKGNEATVKLPNGKLMKLDIMDVDDEFTFNPLGKFKLNQIIDVIQIDEEHVATKASAFEGTMTEPELVEGNIVNGYVCHDSKGALLVRIARGVAGRLPYGQIANCFIKDPLPVFPIGTVMKVKIMEVKDKQITLSSRYSDINGKTLTVADLKVGEVVTGFITSVKDFGIFVRLCDYDNHSGLVHRSTLDGKSPLLFQEKINSRVHVEVTAVDLNKEKISLKLESIEDLKPAEEEVIEEAESSETEEAGPSDNEMELDIEVSDDEDEKENQKKKLKEKATEEEITKIEANHISPTAPKTEEEFVQALVHNQNSSKLWIEFMNFYFASGNSKRAEEVGRNALDKFPIGEKKEKKNIYLALISLKVLSTESKDFVKDCTPIVDEAAQTIEPEPMWLRFATTVQEHKSQYAEEAWKLTLRRCKASVPVWLEYLSTFIAQENPEKANEELKRALGGTFKESKKEVIIDLKKQLATKFFEHNLLEHGRTMFENLISEMPKEYAIWYQYIDSEEEYGDINKARSLYDRLTTNDLKVQQMKKTLQRWLKLEERNGNEPARRKHVSKIAADFKRRITQSGNDNEN